MRIMTTEKRAWDVLGKSGIEHKITKAELMVDFSMNLNLKVTGENEEAFIFNNILCAVQSEEDTICFIIPSGDNFAIILENGDDVTWLKRIGDTREGKCLLDSFFNYTPLGQYIKENEVYKKDDK